MTHQRAAGFMPAVRDVPLIQGASHRRDKPGGSLALMLTPWSFVLLQSNLHAVKFELGLRNPP